MRDPQWCLTQSRCIGTACHALIEQLFADRVLDNLVPPSSPWRRWFLIRLWLFRDLGAGPRCTTAKAGSRAVWGRMTPGDSCPGETGTQAECRYQKVAPHPRTTGSPCACCVNYQFAADRLTINRVALSGKAAWRTHQSRQFAGDTFAAWNRSILLTRGLHELVKSDKVCQPFSGAGVLRRCRASLQ